MGIKQQKKKKQVREVPLGGRWGGGELPRRQLLTSDIFTLSILFVAREGGDQDEEDMLVYLPGRATETLGQVRDDQRHASSLGPPRFLPLPSRGIYP